jgi:hypothetical protein
MVAGGQDRSPSITLGNDMAQCLKKLSPDRTDGESLPDPATQPSQYVHPVMKPMLSMDRLEQFSDACLSALNSAKGQTFQIFILV